MVNRIYIEESIKEHKRVVKIINKFKNAERVYINNYAEVFNPKSQNFRIQKQDPALVLAKKENKLIHRTPEGFGIGGNENYYFSHMLNCPYDCRYCFLQGMFSSAHYVLFVNYEDFQSEIKTLDEASQTEKFFFSGYDADSLAFEAISEFADSFIPVFNKLKNSKLELRTKSTQIRNLLKQKDCTNIIVAFSFTPQNISKKIEHKVPDFDKRVTAMKQLAEHGFQIGLRFDPLIYADNFESLYQEMLKKIFANINKTQIHSVSIGPLRFPEAMFQKIRNLYPDEKLFSYKLEKNQKMISYSHETEKEMSDFIHKELNQYIGEKIIFNCVNNA